MIKFFVALIPFLCSALALAQAPIPVQRCGTVIERPGLYEVTQDIVCTQPGDKGIIIQNTREVRLNIGAHTIKGAVDPKVGHNGYGIQLHNVTNVTINGTGGRIESFDHSIWGDKVYGLNIGASIQNKFILMPGGHGISLMDGSNVSLSSIVLPYVPWSGLSLSSINGLYINGVWINTTTKTVETGVWVSWVSNANLTSLIINSAMKGMTIQGSKQVRLDSVTVNKASYQGLELHMNDGPVAVTKSQFTSANYGIVLSGHNNGLSIQDSQATSSNFPGNALCKRNPYSSALPTLANTTPSIVKDCF
jgi:hypothetical protein